MYEGLASHTSVVKSAMLMSCDLAAGRYAIDGVDEDGVGAAAEEVIGASTVEGVETIGTKEGGGEGDTGGHNEEQSHSS